MNMVGNSCCLSCFCLLALFLLNFLDASLVLLPSWTPLLQHPLPCLSFFLVVGMRSSIFRCLAGLWPIVWTLLAQKIKEMIARYQIGLFTADVQAKGTITCPNACASGLHGRILIVSASGGLLNIDFAALR